jgi:hypothetical protein
MRIQVHSEKSTTQGRGEPRTAKGTESTRIVTATLPQKPSPPLAGPLHYRAVLACRFEKHPQDGSS